MKSSTFPIRLTWVLILGAVVAGTAASTAGALVTDVRDSGGSAQAYTQSQAVPDVLERFVAAHPYGIRPVPDAIERFATAHPYGLQPVPDVLERFSAAHPYGVGLSSATQPSLSQSNGFNWADYGIGIGSGMGLILVLAVGLAMGWQRRHRMQTA
jgi:hypothetical protein